MSKRRSMFLACFLTALFITTLSAPAASAANEIIIGFILPLSGSSSDIGEQIALGATIAAAEINEKGGVASHGGAKLVLKFEDTQTHPRFGIKATERLIKKENVSVLSGAYNSFVTFPVSEIAEKNKIPFLVNSSVMDEITERGFNYVFRPCNTTYFDAREQFDAIDFFSKETGKRPIAIGQLYEGTEWGRSQARNVRNISKERGYFLVVDEPYFADQRGFSSHLSLITQRKPDLMIVALYTDQHLMFSKQLMDAKVNLPFGIHSVGAGSEDPTFYEKVPQEAVEYMFVQEDWQVDKIEQTGRAKSLDRIFREEFGYGINAYGAQGYSNVWVIYDALERSGSADKDKIRNALAKTNITEGPALITGYQKISFNEKGQSLEAHGVVSQNQGGKRVTVWPQPNRLKGSKLIWPIPPWNER